MKKYRRSLSYHQERIWRDKVVITEKAVKRFKRKFGTRLKAPVKEVVEINPVVEEVPDAARAYEAAAENLPEPPGLDLDEIEVRLLELKKFNEKLLDKDKHPRKKVKVAEAECEIGVIGVHEILKKKVTKRRIKAAKLYVEAVNDSMNIEDENVVEVKNDNNLVRKDEVEEKETKVINENYDKIEVSDVKKCDENYGNKKLIENEDMKDNLENLDADEAEANKSKVVDKSLATTNENSDGKTIEDEYHVEVEENETKVVNRNIEESNEMSDGKIDIKNEFIESTEDVEVVSQDEEKETEIFDENLDESDAEKDDEETVDPDNPANTENEEVMHKQQPCGDGCDNKVVKGNDALMFVPLLQANLAIMLLCVKTIQEQSELLTQLSDLLSRSSSISTPSQPTASFPRAHSSCLTQSRMCSRIPRPTWPSQRAGR